MKRVFSLSLNHCRALPRPCIVLREASPQTLSRLAFGALQAAVAEIEAEKSLVAVNRELMARFEKKIQVALACVRGEEAPGATQASAMAEVAELSNELYRRHSRYRRNRNSSVSLLECYWAVRYWPPLCSWGTWHDALRKSVPIINTLRKPA